MQTGQIIAIVITIIVTIVSEYLFITRMNLNFKLFNYLIIFLILAIPITSVTLFVANNNKTCLNNCSGNGTCDASTGNCICVKGYFGDDCSKQVSINCNGNGTYNEDTKTCTCKGNFTGANCDTCKPNFYGSNCDKYCDGNTCNGNGTCDTKTGECICNSTTSHFAAGNTKCAPGDISGNASGNCSNNFDGSSWEGVKCDERACPKNPSNNLECTSSDQGNCNFGTGKCECVNGYTGDFCSVPPGLSVGAWIGIIFGIIAVIAITWFLWPSGEKIRRNKPDLPPGTLISGDRFTKNAEYNIPKHQKQKFDYNINLGDEDILPGRFDISA